MTPTEEMIQAIVAGKLKIAPSQVPLDQSLLDDIGLDSFDIMGIILEIEVAFPAVSLSDKSAEDLQTLRQVAAYIDSELGRS